MTRQAKRRSAPLSSEYRVRVKRGPRGRVWRDFSSQKREAIRAAHRIMRELGQGAKAEVRTKEGQLIYQAHLSVIRSRWQIVTEEL